jgi:hypothetical protein
LYVFFVEKKKQILLLLCVRRRPFWKKEGHRLCTGRVNGEHVKQRIRGQPESSSDCSCYTPRVLHHLFKSKGSPQSTATTEDARKHFLSFGPAIEARRRSKGKNRKKKRTEDMSVLAHWPANVLCFHVNGVS